MSENSQDQLQIIQQIANAQYQNHSIIRRICKLRPNPTLSDFIQFNEAERHNRTLFQVNEFKIQQMIDHIVVDETNYLINEINNHSIMRNVQENLLQSIQDSVTALFTNGFDPGSIIIPRRLMIDVRRWNREINPNENTPGNMLNVSPNRPLNVEMPAQNVEFNQIMILSEQSNIWEFIPGQNNSILQIGSELTNTDIVFWFREQCRFTNDENDGIITLNLPVE